MFVHVFATTSVRLFSLTKGSLHGLRVLGPSKAKERLFHSKQSDTRGKEREWRGETGREKTEGGEGCEDCEGEDG